MRRGEGESLVMEEEEEEEKAENAKGQVLSDLQTNHSQCVPGTFSAAAQKGNK